jgi:DNA primase
MKKDQAIAWLKLLGAKVPGVQSRGGWTLSDCPLGPWRHDGGKSGLAVFGVKVEPGDSFCNCFACGWSGKQSDLVLDIKVLNKRAHHRQYQFGELLQLIAMAEENAELEGINSPDIEEMLFGAREEMHEFPEWWLESFPSWQDVKFARDYLSQRNVPVAIRTALDLRADTQQKRVCFPVRDFEGVLRGLHGRATEDETEPRYRMYTHAKKNNPIVWLGESWVDLTKPIVVVEGPFDITSVLRVYANVVSPLFSNPSFEKLKRMADAMEWFTLFDRGTGGDKGRARVSSFLTSSVVTHLLPPEGCKDPGVMSVEQLVAVLGPHLQLHELNLE